MAATKREAMVLATQTALLTRAAQTALQAALEDEDIDISTVEQVEGGSHSLLVYLTDDTVVKISVDKPQHLVSEEPSLGQKLAADAHAFRKAGEGDLVIGGQRYRVPDPSCQELGPPDMPG